MQPKLENFLINNSLRQDLRKLATLTLAAETMRDIAKPLYEAACAEALNEIKPTYEFRKEHEESPRLSQLNEWAKQKKIITDHNDVGYASEKELEAVCTLQDNILHEKYNLSPQKPGCNAFLELESSYRQAKHELFKLVASITGLDPDGYVPLRKKEEFVKLSLSLCVALAEKTNEPLVNPFYNKN